MSGMTGHGAHAAIEMIAAVVLVLSGGLVLALAARRRLALGPGVASPPSASAWTAPRRAISLPAAVAVALSLGAAAIHLAAGPSHVGALGDLGLGFYWAALFQGGWAVSWLAQRSRSVAWVGIAGNLAIVGAWLGSRTVGLPIGPEAWRPESIGVPDLTALVFQLLLVAILSLELARGGALATIGRRIGRPGSSGLVAGVPIVGILFLATTLAVATAAGGHAHDQTALHGGGPVSGAHAP
jgi:hypothetical protein